MYFADAVNGDDRNDGLTPATAFAPSSPIHAISIILYAVPSMEEIMIGSASSARVFRIGPEVRSTVFDLLICNNPSCTNYYNTFVVHLLQSHT